MPKGTPSASNGSGADQRIEPESDRKAASRTRGKARDLTSRAVLREVEPGSTVECVHCGERVKFQAKMRHKQVICNVYVAKRWDRVEHFHAPCYEEAREPHGEVDTTPPVRRSKTQTEPVASSAPTAS